MFNEQDFKEYRKKIGFTNQNGLKEFLSAKDLTSGIDYEYISKLTNRLKEIVLLLNEAVDSSIKLSNAADFCKKYIDESFEVIKRNNILPRLNNQGRRPEQVYFSWMRGDVIAQFFKKALAVIFKINETSIRAIGEDRLDTESFSRQPTADFELELDRKKVRIEMQSGFQGVNDIKEHKVREARKQYEKNAINSIVAHFDLFNGQVAFVNICQIKEDDINWITRQQMEGQTVFNISQNYFIWRITDKCPPIEEIKECIFE